MALSDFFDRLGTNIGNAPPEAWFALSDGLINRKGLAGGINAFAREAQAGRKRQGMADALQGMMGDLTPQQQKFLSVADPEAAFSVLGTKLFGGGSGKNWKVVDSDNDGLPDYQIEEGSGKIEAHPLTASDRIRTALGVQNIPGLGSVDKFGNPVGPIGPGAAPPQLRPAITTEVAPTSSPAAAAEFGGEPGKGAALAPPPAVVTATPTKTPAPSTTGKIVVPIPTQQLGAFGLGSPQPGNRFVRDFDAKTRTWSGAREEKIPGSTGKTPIETQIKNQGFHIRQTAAEQTLQNPAYLEEYMSHMNSLARATGLDFFQSGNSQVVQQAGDEWINSLLRPDSGAAIPEPEFARYRRTYIPEWGNKDELLAQKRAARVRAAEGIKAGLTPEQVVAAEEVIQKNPNPGAAKAQDDLSDVDEILGLPTGPAGGPLLDGPPTMQPRQSSFAAPDDVMLAQGGGTVSAPANGLGMAPPETLAQIGRRGPRMLSPQFADIEHARGGIQTETLAKDAKYKAIIKRVMDGWKKDKAKVMASPEYKFLEQTGILPLLNLGG